MPYFISSLLRWGVADETLNVYFETEEEKRQYLAEVQFQEGRDEYLPIPQQQIDFSKGLYQQSRIQTGNKKIGVRGLFSVHQ